MKADKYGNVTVQGRHRYAAGPEHAGHEMIVGLRALEVEILDAEGKRVITHPRSYGDKPTDSGDPSSQLGLLCDRPAAWRNSRVRDAMCFASMFVRQVRQCFSAVWADGFPRCRHRFPVM